MTHRFAIWILLGTLAILVLGLNACKQDPLVAGDNPYNNIDYYDQTDEGYPLVPGSITDIHQRVFSLRCAYPGCHDGNFEPDFRTVQSTYATLVYQKIIKNDEDENFQFRVLPGDTGASVLHERLTNCCFVNTNDRMPQDNIGEPLEAGLIKDIEDWILDSARNMYGEVPIRPDTKPYLRYWNITTAERSVFYRDKIDGLWYNPIWIDDSSEVTVGYVLTDDLTPVPNFRNVRFKWSLDYANFTNSVEHLARYERIGKTDFWLFEFDPDTLIPDTNYYLRIYLNDGQHMQDTEFPHDGLKDVYKTRYGFRIRP